MLFRNEFYAFKWIFKIQHIKILLLPVLRCEIRFLILSNLHFWPVFTHFRKNWDNVNCSILKNDLYGKIIR